MSKLYLSMQNSPRPLVLDLLPLAAIVFIAFIVVGLAIPALSLPVGVGMYSGARFWASLLSRFWSGSHANRRGAKRALVVGCATAAETGSLHLDCACAFAAGAPAGTALYNLRGFASIAWATSALPLVTLASVLRMSLVVTNQAARRTASLRSVPGSVSGLPAVILACSLGVASSLAISAALWARRHRGQIHEQPAT